MLACLRRLADRHGIPFRDEVLPRSEWLESPHGQRLHFLHWQGRGPRVLLLHGGALTAHTWDLVCLALSADFECVALDMRGHGESAWADHYLMELAVQDVTAVLEVLGEGPAHLVGMSLGGNVAAHTTLAHPDRVASLTLVDVADRVNFAATAKLRSFMGQGPRQDLESMVEAALLASPGNDRDTLRYRYHHMTRSTPDGLVWRHDGRRPPDFLHILGKLAQLAELAHTIACPVLIARGARSRVLDEDAAQAFAQRFAAGRYLPIPDAGHNVQEDNPRALATALHAHVSAACSRTR